MNVQIEAVFRSNSNKAKVGPADTHAITGLYIPPEKVIMDISIIEAKNMNKFPKKLMLVSGFTSMDKE